jgi:hypothetical protein
LKPIVTATALLCLSGCAANSPAQPAAVKPCAATMSPAARKIFDAVQAGPTDGTLRERISTQTRALVMMGDLSRWQARPAAEQAADCLRAPS